MRYSFIILIGIFLFLTSCFRDDLENIKVPAWNPNIAIPLINSEFTLADIIADYKSGGNLATDSTGLITLIINRNRVFSIAAHELFQVPAQNFSSTDTVQFIEFAFPHEALIHSVAVKEGKLILHFSSGRAEEVRVNIVLPKATLNGVPLQEEIILHTATITSDTIDLSGYLLNLTGEGDTANVLKIEYHAQTLSGSLPIILDEFSGSLQDISFSYAEGFFGVKNFEIDTDTLSIQFLRNWIEGTIYINHPKIGITLNNDFGMPFSLELSNFEAIKSATSLPITGSIFTDNITVNFPQDSLSEGSAVTDVNIDPDNSNIANVIAFSPNKIIYRLLLGINSSSDNATTNYLRDTSEIFANVQLDLPFQGRVDNLILQDTFDLDIDKIEELTQANFKLTVNNSFPVDAQIQVFFTDADVQPIDSLLTAPENIIASGITNLDGEVIRPATQTTFIAFEEKKLKNLYSARKLIVRARLSAGSTQQPSIRLLSSYRIDMHLGVIAGIARE